MALFLLEDGDFKGFWMKIWNAGVSVITRSTFSSFFMLFEIKLNLYFMVHRIVLKLEKIWLSRTLNIIRKPKKSLFSMRKRAITQER
jgi:hypothetical protein